MVMKYLPTGPQIPNYITRVSILHASPNKSIHSPLLLSKESTETQVIFFLIVFFSVFKPILDIKTGKQTKTEVVGKIFFKEKFPLPYLCTYIFFKLGQLQVASSKELYPAINQIEASLKRIKSSVFHQFHIPALAPAKQTQPGCQDKQMGLGRRGASFWRQPSSLNFLRSRYKRAFMEKVLPHLKSVDSVQTLPPFTGYVGLRCVQLSDYAKPASQLPAAHFFNPQTKTLGATLNTGCFIRKKIRVKKDAGPQSPSLPPPRPHPNREFTGGE